jgi:iron complex transport system permease protein
VTASLLRAAAGLAALAVSTALAITIGPADIGVADVWSVVAAHAGGAPSGLTPIRDGIVWELRLPRTLLAAVCGAGPALCGAVMQSLLRNPLADPFVLGVSSGASTGAVAVVVLGVGGGVLPVSGGAFAGAVCSFAAMLLLSQPWVVPPTESCPTWPRCTATTWWCCARGASSSRARPRRC